MNAGFTLGDLVGGIEWDPRFLRHLNGWTPADGAHWTVLGDVPLEEEFENWDSWCLFSFLSPSLPLSASPWGSYSCHFQPSLPSVIRDSYTSGTRSSNKSFFFKLLQSWNFITVEKATNTQEIGRLCAFPKSWVKNILFSGNKRNKKSK